MTNYTITATKPDGEQKDLRNASTEHRARQSLTAMINRVCNNDWWGDYDGVSKQCALTAAKEWDGVTQFEYRVKAWNNSTLMVFRATPPRRVLKGNA